MPKVSDSRQKLYLKAWESLGLSGKIKKVELVESYLLDHELNNDQLNKVSEALTNSVLEKSGVNVLPSSSFNYVIEVGFLPGVTDNVAHTTKETITDLLGLPGDAKLSVYSSKVFLVSGTAKFPDMEKIASLLHNPLIERTYIRSAKDIKNEHGLPLRLPEVILPSRAPVIKVPLQVSDEELARIGKEGIMDPDGKRRGPLALDLPYMKTIQAHFKKLGRDPYDIELEALAQTWSEHCKHTIFANPIGDIKDGLYKTYIKGATNLIRQKKGNRDFCVSVFSDNAGGIIFDENHLITHKVETHNTPSLLDPFGGAITGIVGVNRDTIGFGLGAKPVANVYGFCFGNPEDERKLYLDKDKKLQIFSPKRIMQGVIKGVNSGGNTSGIPTPHGFLKFDDRYRGKPLVFAGTIGLIPRKIHDKFSHEKKAEPGDYIVVIGGRVGIDGIHGATFSSVALDASSPASAVQIGDPITQKKFSDAIIKEARDMDLYNSITDNGAGGISCSVAEMAKECGGAVVDIEKVPLKYPGMRPWEIWISESQERMTLAVPKKKWGVFQTLMKSRGVEATIIGEFTDSGNCVVTHNGNKIMDISLEFLHNGLPKLALATEKPVKDLSEPAKSTLPFKKALEEMLANKNLSGNSFVADQYDHEVQSGSVLKPLVGPGRLSTDAQIFKPVLSSDKGVVLSSALYPSYGDKSSYDMAACAVDTTIRNILAAGGALSHLALLDNFCWCSSDEKRRLGELVEAVRACYDHAVGYGTPFISGKDSMFNDFKGFDENGNPVKISIPPTILISGIGVMQDTFKAVSPEFKNAGDEIYLLGETHDELGAGEYYKLLAGKLGHESIGNKVPKVDIKRNLRTYSVLEEIIDKELVNSSISINSGGLAVALARASIGAKLGAIVSVDNLKGSAKSMEAKLFSESQGRILVSVSQKNLKKFEQIIKKIPHTRMGKVSKDGKFIVSNGSEKLIETKVDKLAQNYHSFSKSMA